MASHRWTKKEDRSHRSESSIELMDWLVPHYTSPPTPQVPILGVHFNTGGKMCPRGGQLYLMFCIGPKGFWARGSKKYCVIFPQHTSLQPSTLHPQKQWLHCTEEVRILSFLLLPRQHLQSSSSRALQRAGEDFFNTNDCCLLAAQTWAALVVFGANSSSLTAGIFLSQCCPAVTPK